MDASYTGRRGSGDPGTRPEIRSSGWSWSEKLVHGGGGGGGASVWTRAAAVLARDRASLSDVCHSVWGRMRQERKQAQRAQGPEAQGQE